METKYALLMGGGVIILFLLLLVIDNRKKLVTMLREEKNHIFKNVKLMTKAVYDLTFSDFVFSDTLVTNDKLASGKSAAESFEIMTRNVDWTTVPERERPSPYNTFRFIVPDYEQVLSSRENTNLFFSKLENIVEDGEIVAVRDDRVSSDVPDPEDRNYLVYKKANTFYIVRPYRTNVLSVEKIVNEREGNAIFRLLRRDSNQLKLEIRDIEEMKITSDERRRRNVREEDFLPD